MRGLFAHQGALRFLAISWTMALPITERLLTNTFTSRRRVCALCVARRLFADCVTFRAGSLFAVLHRAAHFTLWFITLDLTF